VPLMNQNSVGYSQLKDMVMVSVMDRTPLLILGDPGLGKTSIVRQQAAEIGIGMMETLAYLYEPVDMRGLLVPKESNQTTVSYSLGKWPLQRLVDEGVYPQRGILLLDEMLNAHRDVLTAFAEPLCDHTVNGEPLAKGWNIVATGNHMGGGTSSNAMPAQVANRVCIVKLVPDWNEWLVWAINRIRPELIGYFGMQNGLDLFAYDPSKNQPNTPYLTPRSLELLSRRLNAWDSIGRGRPPMHVYSSVIGEYGGKLYATLDYIHELVSWEEILSNPSGCRRPSSAPAIYSQVGIISGKLKSESLISKRSASAAMTFISGFGLETQALAMKLWCQATKKDTGGNSWGATPEFARWHKDNQREIL